MKKLEKSEFWEASFTDKKEMWGLTPSQSTIIAKDFFVRNSLRKILVPGFGRNAQIFRGNGMSITGIEISETAIKLAKKHYGTDMKVHHGSVTEMLFDNEKYDWIFCYALIHLLSGEERQKLIEDCYNQLADNGFMIFTMISKVAENFPFFFVNAKKSSFRTKTARFGTN